MGVIMSKQEKLIAQFLLAKKDFKWVDLVAVLKSLGFEQIEAEGSRVDFVKATVVIHLHKPHPQKEVKAYALKQLKTLLKQEKIL
jgi:predicted RNA binding protein YcfA (HicA-like mRNA interferase family)